MTPFLNAVLIFGAFATAESHAVVPSTRQALWQYNGGEFVDMVLANVRQGVINAGLDDIHLPDVSIKLFNQSLAVRNQSIIGMANVYRVGDVGVEVTLFTTKFVSGFAVYNVSSDADVEIILSRANYSEGHIHMDCDNVTAAQVFKLNHLTQSLTLDEFAITIGACNYNASGLGDRVQQGSAMLTEIFANIKDPILRAFNSNFRVLINAGLEATKSALLSSTSLG